MCIRDSAYTYIEKAADDLTPRTKENLTLEELMKTWMAKMEDNCLFISCLLYTSKKHCAMNALYKACPMERLKVYRHVSYCVDFMEKS